MIRRNTKQRELVINAINCLCNHPTAEEIYSYIVKDNPNVSKGTVYRNLDILVKENKIKKIETSDGANHYDHMLHDHVHIKCVKCGCVYDVDVDEIPDLTKLVSSNNMDILGFDILFKGICPKCKKGDKNNG